MSKTSNILLGLDLVESLTARVLMIAAATKAAHAAGGDLTPEQLQGFADADEVSRASLQAKIDAAKAAGR